MRLSFLGFRHGCGGLRGGFAKLRDFFWQRDCRAIYNSIHAKGPFALELQQCKLFVQGIGFRRLGTCCSRLRIYLRSIPSTVIALRYGLKGLNLQSLVVPITGGMTQDLGLLGVLSHLWACPSWPIRSYLMNRRIYF